MTYPASSPRPLNYVLPTPLADITNLDHISTCADEGSSNDGGTSNTAEETDVDLDIEEGEASPTQTLINNLYRSIDHHHDRVMGSLAGPSDPFASTPLLLPTGLDLLAHVAPSPDPTHRHCRSPSLEPGFVRNMTQQQRRAIHQREGEPTLRWLPQYNGTWNDELDQDPEHTFEDLHSWPEHAPCYSEHPQGGERVLVVP